MRVEKIYVNWERRNTCSIIMYKIFFKKKIHELFNLVGEQSKVGTKY